MQKSGVHDNAYVLHKIHCTRSEMMHMQQTDEELSLLGQLISRGAIFRFACAAILYHLHWYLRSQWPGSGAVLI